MGMALGRVMDVDVDEAWSLVRVGEDEARLLLAFAQGRLPWTFAGVEMATGLHPAVETFVEVEDGTPGADDDGGPGDVDGVRRLVEGTGQPVEVLQDDGPGLGLAGVGRPVAAQRLTDGLDDPVGPAAVLSLLAGAVRHACIPSTQRPDEAPGRARAPVPVPRERGGGPTWALTQRVGKMLGSAGAVNSASATGAPATGGKDTMGEFAKAFDRFVAAEPVQLLEATRPRPSRPSAASKSAGKTTPGRSQPGMSADSLSRILKTAEGSVVAAGSSDVAITKLAEALVRDPKDGVKALRRWGRKAKKDPHKAMGALATFGEVLKRAVALLRCVPQRFGSIIEAFHDVAAAVAEALEAASFSITFDLPRTISIAFSWTP